jgi:hypothetical protein
MPLLAQHIFNTGNGHRPETQTTLGRDILIASKCMLFEAASSCHCRVNGAEVWYVTKSSINFRADV